MINYVLLSVICYFSLLISIKSYSSQIAMNLTTSQTITNFNTDLGACSCDISTACDVFCCCDPNCSTDQVTTWTNSNWCGNSTTQIQKLCSNIGSKGFSTFEDLGCVFFSNRGSIGMFYGTPSPTNFVDPNIPKFAVRNLNAQTTSQYTVPAISSYQQNSPLKVLINGSSSQLPIWIPALGQSCRQSFIAIKEGVSYYKCVYGITNSQSCEQINKKLVTSSAIQVCAFGDCSSNLSTNMSSYPASTYDNATGLCSNVINNIQISIKIDYIGSQYKVTSMNVSLGTPVNVVGKVYITNNINIQKVGTSLSGKPGYIFGKPLVYSSGAINSIADSNQQCVTTTNVGTNILNLKFGVNESFTCLSVSPCSSQLYIDSVVLGTGYKFLKYASKTTEQISVQGLSQKSCQTQSFTLYILYSYSGWILEPQYYILGSKIVTSTNANPTTKMKQLNVKWIKVSPSEISTPPSNNFYAYFQKLWLPLQSAYYNKVSFEYSFHYVLALGLFSFFIF